MKRRNAATAIAALLPLAGCAVQNGAPWFTREVAMPADLAALVCAEACRATLPNADPVPYHAGAPASVLGPGEFEIRYELRRDGRWLPVASGRIAGQPDADPVRLPRVVFTPMPDLDGTGCTAGSSILVSVVANGTGGCRVTAEVTEPFAAELTGHLAHVLATGAAAAAAAERLRTGLDPLPALATARDAGCCCKAHRSWQALLQLQTAVGLLQQGDRQAAHGAVLHAVSIEPHFAATLKVAGEIAQLLGQDGSSGRELDTAVWFLADPEVRGQTAARAALAMSRLQSPRPGPRLRADAAASMTSGDLDSAAALLRAARELEPDVEADLLLRRRLCLLRADPRGALGASLLLREYAPSLLAQQHLQRDYAAVGYRDLADRLAGSGPEHAVGRRTSPSDLAPAVTATAGAAPAAPGR